MTEQNTVQISEKEGGAEGLQVSHGPCGSVFSHWEDDEFCHYLNITDKLREEALTIAKRKIYSTEFLAAVESKNKEVVKSFLDRTDCNKTRFMKLFKMASFEVGEFWTSKCESDLSFDTWKMAGRIATEKCDADILSLLFNYDLVVQSQEGGNNILHRCLNHIDELNSTDLRFIELILRSGKIFANALNFKAQTALHLVPCKTFTYFVNGKRFFHEKLGKIGLLDRFNKRYLCRGIHRNEDNFVNITRMLLEHNVNINQKDCKGKTALMKACKAGCLPVVRTILKWTKETSTGLDLDARDIHGQTALMKAAMWKHSDVVEMLLNAGASVNFSDNRRFTVLHHALYEIMNPDLWFKYGDLPRNCEELKIRRDECITLFESEEPHEYYCTNREELNEHKIKVLEHLLKRSDVNINSLDCEGYSPLDRAEATIPKNPSSILDALKAKGANLNVFEPHHQNIKKRSYSNSRLTYDNRDENMLHRFSPWADFFEMYYLRGSEENDRNKFGKVVLTAKEKILECSEDALAEMTIAKDRHGRTPLHCASMHFTDNFPFMISLGCSFNEADNYGRTALHYEGGKILLASKVADPTIKDRDGIQVFDMIRERGKKSKEFSEKIQNLPQSPHDVAKERLGAISIYNGTIGRKRKSFAECRKPSDNILKPRAYARKLLKKGKYVCCNRITKLVKRMRKFIDDISGEIKRRDSRFEVWPKFVGSSFEGTKIDLPEDFDFNLILKKFSKMCKVFTSPELPPGYVYLKRMRDKDGEDERQYDSFFTDNGILMTQKVNKQFKLLLASALEDPQFMENQKKFDWDWHLTSDGSTVINIDSKFATTLKLNRNRPTFKNGKTVIAFGETSIDIVPCVHIDGYWPDEALSDISDDLKADGCNLFFDWPQRRYPWAPFSEHCARISFSPAESKMIRQSSRSAKSAYMLGKQFNKILPIWYGTVIGRPSWKCNTSYILKSCFLYCIEALMATPEKSTELGIRLDECYGKTDLHLHIWLETLIQCFYKCILQDFCPSYFMPSFFVPVGKYLKDIHTHYFEAEIYDFSLIFKRIHDTFCCLSTDAADVCFQLPLPNPIFEEFDRTKFIEELSESASKKLKMSKDITEARSKGRRKHQRKTTKRMGRQY